MGDWVSFWNGAHAVYVNERHRHVHYARIAADLSRLLPAPGARVLDFGCGDALGAADLARTCGRLLLCDAAPAVRARLAARFSHVANIQVCTPEEVEALPPGSLDLVVCNSVAQYLSRDELASRLTHWRRLLAEGGGVLVADVIPKGASAVADVGALLALAAREGFLLAALVGLGHLAVSPYRGLRRELGLTTYDEAEMLALLEATQMSARRVHPNVGHNQRRMAFLAVRD